MKDGTTHLAHKAEHAVDMDSGAILAVTLQPADAGDHQTLADTINAATANLAAVADDPRTTGTVNEQLIEEAVTDKGYHSNATMQDLQEMGIRSYVAEPDRGRRNWKDEPEAQQPVYANRRRMRGQRGKELMRKRGELIERSFAHCYETGGMRRLHLRGRENIFKRLVVHAGAFNLSLILRQLIGKGTPRGLQGLFSRVLRPMVAAWNVMASIWRNRVTADVILRSPAVRFAAA
jgi:transposase